MVKSNSNHSEDGSDKPYIKLPYGVVENAGCPEGYKGADVILDIRSADHLGYDDTELVITTQPLWIMGTTLQDCPDGWTECFITGWVKRKILTTPGFPSPVRHPPRVNHRISEVPGIGFGMFATRNLRAGDLILAERPLVIAPRGIRQWSGVPKEYTEDQLMQATMSDWEKKLEMMVDRMEPTRREKLMNLANCHQFDGSGPILGIIRTNCFEVPEIQDPVGGEASHYCVVGNDVSRMNHSCSPNVTRTWNMASFSMQIWAVRDIKKDEEITISYCEVLAPAADRQKELAPYGFKCTCDSCADPAISDPLRAKCCQIDERKGEGWAYDLTLPKSPNVRPLLGDLITIAKEGLQDTSTYGYILFKLMKTYAAMGDVKNTTVYATKFSTWLLYRTGSTVSVGKIMGAYKMVPWVEGTQKATGLLNGKGKQKAGT